MPNCVQQQRLHETTAHVAVNVVVGECSVIFPLRIIETNFDVTYNETFAQ